MVATRRHVRTATVQFRRIGRQSTRYTRKECTQARLEAQKPPRTDYGLAGAPLELSEKDSMACTRKLAQGMEHRQDSHLVFISHLDHVFKVRACACLSVFCLCLCLLIRSLLTSRTSVLDISPAFWACAQCLDSLTRPLIFAILGVAFKCTLTSGRHFAATLLSSSGASPRSTTPQANTSNPSNTPLVSSTAFEHSP
jgi:hypothetical protein